MSEQENTVILTGYVIIPEDEFDIIASAITEHIRLSLAEPGCLKFTVTADKNNPYKFTLYEEFVDMDAFLHHKARTQKGEWARVSKNMQRHFSVVT